MSTYRFDAPLIEILCQELQQKIINHTVVNCVGFDTSRFLLILEGLHKSQNALFFCFHLPLIRFHLAMTPNIKTCTRHPLASFLDHSTIIKISHVPNDRIIEITFSTSHGIRQLIGEFFSKHPNFYLIDEDKNILFSLHQSGTSHYQRPSPRNFTFSPPLWANHRQVEQAYASLEFNQQKEKLQSEITKKLKNIKKREEKLQILIKECDEWERIQHEGDLIKSHLSKIKRGTTLFQAHDWITNQVYELTFDPKLTPQDEMKGRYKRARKLQTGKTPLLQQLIHIQNELLSLQKLEQQIGQIQTLEGFEKFQYLISPRNQNNRGTTSLKAAPKPYNEYHSKSGMKILVGKNAKANEKLTFHLANGRDWWLHVNGYSGSHVIIRMDKKEKPDPETLEDAFQLALYHSKARPQGEGEICFTERKYVSRLGQKKTGQVQISQHQVVWVRLDPSRLQGFNLRP